jgi:hypothetical protein
MIRMSPWKGELAAMISPVAHREAQRERERERDTHTHTHTDCDQDREIEAHEKWDPFVGSYSSELDSEYPSRWREWAEIENLQILQFRLTTVHDTDCTGIDRISSDLDEETGPPDEFSSRSSMGSGLLGLKD